MQGRIVSQYSLLLVLLLSGVILVSCGGGTNNPLPTEPIIQPSGTVTGIGFDGLLINSVLLFMIGQQVL